MTARTFGSAIVVVAFGDGDNDLAGDLILARERATPFVRHLSGIKNSRIDTLAFAGPHLVHPSSVAILCPTDRLPAQDAF